jgi:DNA invertase Pin-like site-specific DNA recombinase
MSAAYYRVSTDRQGQSGLGLEAQQAAVHAFLGGRPPSAEFVEVESGKVADRPQLAQALAYARANHCELIVAKLDRLARDVQMILSIVDSGVSVRFLDLPEINPNEPTGRLMLTMMASFAEFERRLISKRTKDALQAKKARGHKLGSPNPAAGARAAAVARLKRSSAKAEHIASIIAQAQAAGCVSLRQIGQALEARGVKTINGCDRWAPAQVAAIIARSA